MSEKADTLAASLPPTQVVALGYSIVGSVSDNAQITFHHAIAEDEDDKSVNAKLDRIFGLIDRLRAKYEAPALRKELQDLEDMNAQVVEDMDSSANNYKKAQADLDVQIATFQSEYAKYSQVAQEQYKASGRGGAYEPKGQTKIALDRIKMGVDAAIEAKVRNDNERDQFLANIGVSTKRREVRIEIVKARLAEIEKMVT